MKTESKVDKLAIGGLVLIIFIVLIPAFFPVSHHGRAGDKMQAKLEMSAIAQAIEAYHQEYGRMPVSPEVQATAKTGDFTYGAIIKAPDLPMPIGTCLDGNAVLNSEVVSILIDFTNFPGDRRRSTVNTNHCLNPQQTKFLNARMTADDHSSSVGPDLVYRDPWGTPYFITLDINEDGKCDDVLYRKRMISQMNGGGAAGYHGLSNNIDAGGNGNHFQYSGQVMVWSAGPDRKINFNVPADQGENRDNIISWP